MPQSLLQKLLEKVSRNAAGPQAQKELAAKVDTHFCGQMSGSSCIGRVRRRSAEIGRGKSLLIPSYQQILTMPTCRRQQMIQLHIARVHGSQGNEIITDVYHVIFYREPGPCTWHSELNSNGYILQRILYNDAQGATDSNYPDTHYPCYIVSYHICAIITCKLKICEYINVHGYEMTLWRLNNKRMECLEKQLSS